MQIVNREWEERLRPLLEEEGAELLEAQVSRGRNSLRLRFFIDREAGLAVDDLARLSRKIALRLDGDPSLAGRYEMEVSSPGMNRVVFREGHFRRFVGERVHIRLADIREGRRNFEGAILGCESGIVEVDVEGLGATSFALNEIERAELRLDPRRPPQRPVA